MLRNGPRLWKPWNNTFFIFAVWKYCHWVMWCGIIPSPLLISITLQRTTLLWTSKLLKELWLWLFQPMVLIKNLIIRERLRIIMSLDRPQCGTRLPQYYIIIIHGTTKSFHASIVMVGRVTTGCMSTTLELTMFTIWWLSLSITCKIFPTIGIKSTGIFGSMWKFIKSSTFILRYLKNVYTRVLVIGPRLDTLMMVSIPLSWTQSKQPYWEILSIMVVLTDVWPCWSISSIRLIISIIFVLLPSRPEVVVAPSRGCLIVTTSGSNIRIFHLRKRKEFMRWVIIWRALYIIPESKRLIRIFLSLIEKLSQWNIRQRF